MKAFRDTEGREWLVRIDVAAIKRVRGLVGVDLYGLAGDGFKGLAALLGDPVQLVDVLYVLCKGQADERKVSDEDFGRAMAGDSLEHASDAFLEELCDFFPQAARAGLKKAIAKGRAATAMMAARLEAEVDAIDVGSLVETLSASSGSSPGPSGSTPGRSPSASST